FIVSNRIVDAIITSEIHSQVLGSDHCPIALELNGSYFDKISKFPQN
ncbi:MAG: hypothetical protein GX072_05715, partial [Lysinibacillus sp.]|nr:hypothetical protein [Lysinibacillus sp.]